MTKPRIGILALSACCLASAAFAGETPLSLGTESLQVQVLPSHGARVTSLKWQGRELLYVPEDKQLLNNWGSTFWISPQSLWGWPPVATFDSDPYAILQTSNTEVRLGSGKAMSVRVEKTVTVDPTLENQILMNYQILAQAATPSMAAWEVTRVNREGLAIFKARPGSIKTTMGSVDYVETADGFVLVDFNKATQEGKLIGNSTEGWLAWVHGGTMYVKRYEAVPYDLMAKGEGDIEIYISGKSPYAELEVQSAADALQTGEVIDFTVRWLLCDVSVAQAADLQNLPTLVEGCISRH